MTGYVHAPAEDMGDDAAGPEAGLIPFPRRGDDLGQQWRFRREVQFVGGAEGEWLRGQLSTVMRNLMAWAAQDIAATGVDLESRPDKERAA